MGLARYPWIAGKLLALAWIFVGGGILAVTAVPVAMLFPGDRVERAQQVIRATFRAYVVALGWLGLVSITVEDITAFRKLSGVVVIANHPTLLDVVVLMAVIPRTQCIVKHQLWRHWFLGPLMRAAGYIRNDLEPDQFVAQCRAALSDGRCLIIFPEGTRSSPGAPFRFQRGFANIAFLTQAPVQSVVISCSPLILYKGEPLLHAPRKKPALHFNLGDCLDKDFYLLYKQRGVAVRKIVNHFEGYYRKSVVDGNA